MKARTLTCLIVITVFAILAVPIRMAAQHANYKLVDMGTLGGPASYLTEPGNGRGFLVLNSRGELAGKSDTPIPNNGSGNCPPICFDTKVFRWERNVLIPLDGLSTTIDNSDVGSINSRGWIAGNSATGDIDPITGGQIVHAVLWKENKAIDLGTLGSGLESSAAYVNDGGEVVGVSTINTIPDPFSFLGGSIHPFIWKDGVMRDLGTLGTGTDAFTGSSCANKSSGQVTGFSFIDYTDLGTLGGDFTITTWLNDAGEVVGGTTTAGEAEFHAALWRDGSITDLGTLDGDCFSLAHAVNSSGQIVGESGSCFIALRAFLWDEGRIVDLNTLIPANSSLQLVVAANINDKGEIAGTGTPPGCADYLECGHAFLLIPCAVDEDCGSITRTSVVETKSPFNAMTLTQRREMTKAFVARLRTRAAKR